MHAAGWRTFLVTKALAIAFCVATVALTGQADGAVVPLNKVFEASFTNTNTYANKFRDVELEAVFTSPSGSNWVWRGFFDGDGSGGGDYQTGNVWRLRFMPTEVGEWNYTYSWTDGTPGGNGSFNCTEADAGKGLLRAYKDNPRWFAYGGTEPVFLKSYHLYYEGLLYHDLQWTVDHVYEPLIAAGYNHLQLYYFPTSWYDEGAWKFADAPATQPKELLFTGSSPSTTMNLRVCNSMDEHIGWLNDRNVGMLGHQGFDGNTDGPRFHNLDAAEQEFYVKYMCARYAPYAMCKWNYTWETRGNEAELAWADLLIRYDPWGHARSYHDRYPDYGPEGEADNHFHDERYTFANIENHVQDASTPGNHEPWTHHLTTLASYEGKPVYMSEGNGLWRWFWGAQEYQIHRNAWAVTMAGGSFCWLGHTEGAASTGLFEWADAAGRVDTLTEIMTEEATFHRMTPQDGLLSDIVSGTTCYCLAETGEQYLVYKEEGGSFSLNVATGAYDAVWIDTRTNDRQPIGAIESGGGSVDFRLPNDDTEWLLMVRKQAEPTAYDIWSSTNMPAVTNAALREKTADPDSDGIPNIVEYAFCMDPVQAGGGRGIALETGGLADHWFVAFDMPTNQAIGAFRWSQNLADWHDVVLQKDAGKWTVQSNGCAIAHQQVLAGRPDTLLLNTMLSSDAPIFFRFDHTNHPLAVTGAADMQVSTEAGGQEWYADMHLRAGDPSVQPFIEVRYDLVSGGWLPAASFSFSNNTWLVDAPDWGLLAQSEVEPAEWHIRVALPSLPLDAPVFLRYGVRDCSE